jgi:hypothetical protein
VLLVALLPFTGCGVGPAAVNSSGTLLMQGKIFGGQQPVSGASVKLYAAGKTGNGSAATSMLVLPVTSDANGVFNITGDYLCANANDQVYLAATGGNPGLAAGTNNAALVMVSALGRCSDLPTTPFVSINELTTVAAAWALTPFINSAANVGTTATNAAGLTNGFLNAALLVDPRSGNIPALASNLTTQTGKLAALANSIASCVNSDGGAACSPLFSAATPSGGTAPADTLAAALNVVRNPANNVAAVYNAAGTLPPFASTLSVAPSDWTMSLTVTGGGLNQPTAVGVDAGGNVWVASYSGALSAFSPQGTPFNSAGFGVGTLSQSFGLAVDPNGNVWVSSQNAPTHSGTFGSVSKFMGSTSATPGTLIGTYFDSTMDYPQGLSADTNGNIMIGNYANSSGSIYDNNGNLVIGNLGVGSVNAPVSVAADSTHGMWLANQSDFTVTHVSSTNTVLANPVCCVSPSGIAVDAFGNAWVANYGNGGSLSEVSSGGVTTLTTAKNAGGLASPDGVFIDGAQNVWLPNYNGASFSHFAGNGGTTAAGTALSPSTGFGKDASLALPFAIAADATGDLWLSTRGANKVVMFFGLASPTKTPVTPTPAIP